MQVWIGTSGFAYPDWVGAFYPAGTPSNRMFAHYVRHFPLVELNFTFYRPPTAEGLARLAQQAAPGFQFLVKLHQSFSHELDWTGANAFRQAVQVLQDQGRLLALLGQFPQRFHHTQANRSSLAELADRFAGYPLAVEFRHRSWLQPEVPDWLQAHGLHLVSVDAPSLPALFPTGLVQSSRLIYVRFHSRRAESWYESDKERYDYLYTDEELQEWLTALQSKEGLADRALLLFNNCRRAQAAANAERIRELLAALGPTFEVVTPFESAEPGGQQGMLF